MADGPFHMRQRGGPAPSRTVRSPCDSDVAPAPEWTANAWSSEGGQNSAPLMLPKAQSCAARSLRLAGRSSGSVLLDVLLPNRVGLP